MSEFDNNNTTNNNDVIITSTKQHRGPYRAIERKHKIHEIERLLTAGYDSVYIQSKLGISEPTYNRYRKQAFADSKNAMLGLDINFAMEKISESDRRFRQLSDLAVRLAEDISMDSSSRVDALNVACEIEKQRIILVIKDGPEMLSRLKGYPKTVERVVEMIANKHNLPQLMNKTTTMTTTPSSQQQGQQQWENNNSNGQ